MSSPCRYVERIIISLHTPAYLEGIEGMYVHTGN
jgi:hypothetical protein